MADDIENALKALRSQLRIVKSQGKAINNSAAKAYLEKKIKELHSKLPADPPPSRPVKTSRSRFEDLFPETL